MSPMSTFPATPSVPKIPPISAVPVRPTIEHLLRETRADLERPGPHEVRAAMDQGALLVDVRGDAQRGADGVVPGAIFVARNVLEWRFDPSCEFRDERLIDVERTVIVMCDEGYSSSLAAASLRQLGFSRATDLDGGFQAWRSAGLPVEPLVHG